MELKTAKCILAVLAVVTVVLIGIGVYTKAVLFLIMGFAAAVLSVIFWRLFGRCPYCEKYLHEIRGKHCPHCGENFHT